MFNNWRRSIQRRPDWPAGAKGAKHPPPTENGLVDFAIRNGLLEPAASRLPESSIFHPAVSKSYLPVDALDPATRMATRQKSGAAPRIASSAVRDDPVSERIVTEGSLLFRGWRDHIFIKLRNVKHI